MTVKKYAIENKISIETVRRRIWSGKIKAKLIEGQYIINDNQNKLKIEKLKAEVESLKSKIANRDRIIESKDKGIQVQDDSIAMQTKENKELKVAIEQIGTKLVYARKPAGRKFVDHLSFRG